MAAGGAANPSREVDEGTRSPSSPPSESSPYADMAIRLRFLCRCGRDGGAKPEVPSSAAAAGASSTAADEYGLGFKPASAVAAAERLGVAVPDRRPSDAAAAADDPNLCLANSCWNADMPG